MARQRSRSRLAVASLLLLTGCASGSATTEDPSAAVGTDLAVVEVQHNLPGTASALTILIEPQAGIRMSLGVVDAGETRRFTYDAVPGNYRLIAQGSINSNQFRLSNREMATWNMQLNNVIVRNK